KLEADVLTAAAESMAIHPGDYVDAALSLRYRVTTAEGDSNRLQVRIFSPLTPDTGAGQVFSRADGGDFVAEDPLRPIRIRFEPEGTAIQVTLGTNALRLLRDAD
ncbi:MAG: hypothetical protein ABW163_06245, partial [Luteimonas sp.]